MRVIGLSVAVAALAFHPESFPQQPDPQYGIKGDHQLVGSMIRRYAVSGSSIPINRRYEELTPSERATLHSWWERVSEGDEPPFPLDGLKPIHEAVRQAQRKFLVTGELFLVATVDTKGEVTQVKAIGSPSPEMTKFASTVLLLTKFKPAMCSARPCQMDFPLHYLFRLE